MEKGYTPGCVSIVFVLAIGFFIGKSQSSREGEVLSRLDALSQEVQGIKDKLLSGVQVLGDASIAQASASKEENYEDTFKAQKAYSHQEPDWDQGADPSVSAELGGKGFTGAGWQTNTDYNYIGDPRAVKGGTLRLPMSVFLNTFRPIGKQSSYVPNVWLESLLYEGLIGMDPLTLEWTPGLATHWKEESDGKTYYFRLNPSARWSDGQPVVARDVVATHRLLQDSGIEEPARNNYFEDRIETVEAISKYIVKFTCKKRDWRNMMVVGAGTTIFPSHVLDGLSGAQFLKKFQFKFMPGTGPYALDTYKSGSSITLKRRKDYWAEKARGNIGMHNFDRIKFIVLNDSNTSFEAVKKGEVDLFAVGKAQRWVEELKDGHFATGILQKRKLYAQRPAGLSGLIFNMRKWPFNDRNLRLAINHLVDFDTMNEKFFYKQYFQMASYFQNSPYQYRNMKEIYKYDPEKARGYLAKSGWAELDAEGVLTQNGKRLELDIFMMAGSSSLDRIETLIQQDFGKVGIKVNLVKKNFLELMNVMNERKFTMQRRSLTGSLFPNPKASYFSDLADKPNNNNAAGVKDPRIDELCTAYDEEFDPEKRKKILQEMDRILYEEIVPSALAWYAPYSRFVFHYYLSYPSHYITPQVSYNDYGNMMRYWWFDPEKKEAYDKVLKLGGQLPTPQTEVTYWTDRELN